MTSYPASAAVTPKADFTKDINLSGLKGQSVFITGGVSGLGAGFAEELARNGCCVTCADVNQELGKRFRGELEGKGWKINFVPADVTDYPSLLSAFKSARDFSPTKSIDIVIPCAGLMGQPLIAHLPDPTSSDDPPPPPTAVMDVNLKGVYYTTYLALHYFRTHPSATSTKQLVFLCSSLAYVEAPLVIDYVSSKSAVRGIWRSIRGEKAALGIKGHFRCNLIAPNLVATPMTKDFTGFLQERGFAIAQVEDLVGSMMRVLGDESIDGRAITVFKDGKCWDLCDDFEGQDGGREALKLVESGLLGPGPTKWGRYRMVD
ncbi:NAD(P)-binding protein [Tothia fuscella]|uniref:NAD(P)-binding protein n=1 Tax=Tothia fuscella TaxID=1048955 RepID=A0A9P4NT45_9PEZI|nr:NAD(P)-binding protein [Tothia fuscella]